MDNLSLADIIASSTAGTMADGTAAAPGLPFTNDADTGFYRPAANNIGFATNGAIAFFIGTTNVRTYLPLYLANGGLRAPALAFASDPDLGLYRVAEDQLGVGGVFVLDTYAGDNDGGYDGALSLASKDDTDSGFNWVTGGGGEIEVISQGTRILEFQAAQINALVRTEVEYLSGNPQLVMDRSDGSETFVLFNDSSNDAHIQNLSGSGAVAVEHASGGAVWVQPTATTITNVDLSVRAGDGASSYDTVFTADESAVYAQDGTEGAPGYAFLNHADTGMRASVGALLFSESGTTAFQTSTALDTFVLGVSNLLGPTDLQVTNQLGENVVYSGADETIAVQTNDVTRVTATNDGVQLNSLDGTSTSPGLYFDKAQNTGLSNVNSVSETFTSRTLPSGNQTDWTDMVFADGFFVACGTGNGADSYEYIMRSSDGVTWATASSIGALAPSNFDCQGIAYSSSLDRFVVVGNGSADVIYSDDAGDNWSVSNNGLTQENSWNSVAWNGSVFAAVSSDGTNRVATSSDGITWTLRTAASARSWNTVKWFETGGVFIACNTSGSTTEGIMTSPDGVTWTHRTTPSGVALSAIVVNEDEGEAVVLGFNAAFSSPDGVTWWTFTVPSLGSSYISGVWTGSNYFFHGLNGDYAVSEEGTFSSGTMPNTYDFYAIAHAPSLNLIAHASTDIESIYTNQENQSVRVVSDSTEVFNANAENVVAGVPVAHPYATATGTDSGVTIPDGTGVFELTTGTETGAYALTGPAATAGQLLYVRNDSGQATTGLVVAASGGAMFAHNGTGWLQIAAT